jgi:hypothetical protein
MVLITIFILVILDNNNTQSLQCYLFVIHNLKSVITFYIV